MPLKGESFDGEKFIDKAIEAGAKAYFTTNDTLIEGADLVLKVDNTLAAYLNIAKYYRTKINPITVAITGSSGKTTTKELFYSCLSNLYKSQQYSLHQLNWSLKAVLLQSVHQMQNSL